MTSALACTARQPDVWILRHQRDSAAQHAQTVTKAKKKNVPHRFFFKIRAVTWPLFSTNFFPDLSDFWSFILEFPGKKPIKMQGHGAFRYDEKQKYIFLV